MQSSLELRHLRSLLALKATGSVSRAAELLNLTQSALSHQLKLLEARYQMPLFARKSVPIQFSLLGLKLLALAEQLLPQVDELERDLARLRQSQAGQLRIAVECHTCFDWLMPAMDSFRSRWPEIELDIVSGFHPDPVELLQQARADVALVSEPTTEVPTFPLFQFEMVALLAKGHPLSQKAFLQAEDFREQPLITYAVPDEMLDLVQKVLKPAGINPPRRTTELTIAILQLVASGRGLAALPRWAVQPYLERGYLDCRPIGARGLHSRLYLACQPEQAAMPHMTDFVDLIRQSCFVSLPAIELL